MFLDLEHAHSRSGGLIRKLSNISMLSSNSLPSPPPPTHTPVLDIASPPEKRQMLMVSGAFNHLCDKLIAGEVSADVLQKLAQLVGDLSVRNFASASAIQTVSVKSFYYFFEFFHRYFLLTNFICFSCVLLCACFYCSSHPLEPSSILT